MKQIIKFTKVQSQGKITIDAYNPMFKELGLDAFLNDLLPYSKILAQISIKNFLTLPKSLISHLTNQYLHGAEIIIETPARKFRKTYKLGNSKPLYSYQWVPLDLTAPMPKSLASFKFTYNGQETTYLDAIKTLTSTKYLPNEIWNALDIYSQQMIAKCREYNQGNYASAEEWFKTLMKDCMQANIRIYSPNEKTYYEATAEIQFDKDCAELQLQEGLRPLNNRELIFLKKYAPAYGVEIKKFMWHDNSRKTNHGYTVEPEVVMAGMSANDWSRATFDPRNANRNVEQLPKFVRRGLRVNSNDNDKLLREAYFQLLWIMKNLKDEGLMPGYKRCPHCHEIYKESQGCECGYERSIEFVQADNLLYGIASTYEDIDSMEETYRDMIGADYTDEDLD